jgi:hypothetical protein
VLSSKFNIRPELENYMEKNELPNDDCAVIVIDNKSLIFWDIDIREKNLHFIEQLNSDYFNYIANVNFSILQNPNEEQVDKATRQYAAIALRIAYSQALEVLFSLIFSAIQAPDCIFGWFLKYTNDDLDNVVNKIRRHERILSKFSTPIRGWKDVVNLIFIGLDENQKKNLAEALDKYESLLARFAQDFTDSNFKAEYNSLKHGLRVKMGGFHLAIGAEDTPGIPANPEKMRTVSYSEFGTTFYKSEKIENTPNLIINRNSRNWNPENFYHALHLISMSIKNVKVFLKKINGNLDELSYEIPNDPDFDHKPWRIGSRMNFGVNSRINTSAIPLLSKEEILDIYDKLVVNLDKTVLKES